MAQRALIIGPGGAGTAVMDNMEQDGRAMPVAFVESRPERRAELAGSDYPDAGGRYRPRTARHQHQR